MIFLCFLHSSTIFVDGKPQSMPMDGTGTGAGTGRGAGIFEKLALFNPEMRMTTKKPNPHDPKIR